MSEVKGVSKETIVKVQLNTGKVIEAQRSASEIAEDINNWNTMVCIWEWDFIPSNTILRIQTFVEIWLTVSND